MHSFKLLTVGKRRLLCAGLLAISGWAGSLQVSLAQPPANPIPAASQPAPVENVAVIARPDFSMQIGDTFRLRHDQLGAIGEAVASRAGVVTFESDPRDPTVILVKGVNVGVTQVTIRAKDKNGNDLPPSVRTIQVNPDIAYIISKVKETFPTANLKIIAGGTAGSLIVTGFVQSAEDIEPLQTFINGIVAQYRVGPGAVTYALRISGPQIVQLDVCLATVNRDKIRQLGVDFFHSDAHSFLGTSIGGAGSTSISGGAATTASTGANFVFSSTDGAANFQGFIQALRDERMGKLVANPTLTCLSGRNARFVSGSEEPYGTAGSGGQSGGSGSGVQFRPVGTILTFLPVVIGDGKIRLTVVAENSQKTGEINTGNIVAPLLSAQNIGTTVELENGQSIAVGGLIQNTVSGEVKKYPILGELPFIGTFFRSVTFDEKEEETIIIIRVTLVDALDSRQRSALRLPGSETRPPSDFELYIEGILEAPRGPRDIFPNRVYVPAFKNDVPFGVRSGECSSPGPICSSGKVGLHHSGNGNCATCNTAPAHANMTPASPMTNPAVSENPVQQTQQQSPAVLPSTPMQEPVEPGKISGEGAAVPVVPATESTVVPVVPANEPPAVPVVPVPTPEAAKSPAELPVPPTPPQGEPK